MRCACPGVLSVRQAALASADETVNSHECILSTAWNIKYTLFKNRHAKLRR